MPHHGTPWLAFVRLGRKGFVVKKQHKQDEKRKNARKSW
jgi:hypothetical protein